MDLAEDVPDEALKIINLKQVLFMTTKAKISLTQNRRRLSTGIFSYCAYSWSASGAPTSVWPDWAATIERAIAKSFNFIFLIFVDFLARFAVLYRPPNGTNLKTLSKTAN